MNLRVPPVLAIATLVVAGVVPCFAQAPASPESGSKPKGPQTFDATVSLTGAYDSDVSGSGAAGVTQFIGPEVFAHSNQLSATGEYRWAARDLQIRASGASAWLQDRQSGMVAGLSRSAAAGLTARLPGRTTLIVSQTAVASPSNLYNLFPRAAVALPGAAPAAAHDYGANGLDSVIYTSQATLTHDATRRLAVSVTATGELSETIRPSAAAGPSEFASVGMAGRFARVLTRNTRANGQYSYRAGNFPGSSVIGITLDRNLRVAEHTVELGMAHSLPMSASRRANFDVVLGGVLLTPLEQPLTGPRRIADTRRLIGQAGGDYLFRKTWQIGARYRRGVDYVPELTEPVLTDGLTARLGGWFTRRIEAVAAVGYASGISALRLNGPRFDTYTSDVKLRVALGRTVSIHGEYLYYLYDFRRYAPLVPGMPSALERNGIRVGLTLFAPTLDW